MTLLESKPIRVLVVEDEPAGLNRLVRLVSHAGGAEVVGTAENGEEAIAAMRQLRPDLVFLDIQMPRKTGLDVMLEIGPEAMPVTIFVTAYDEYALRAFDLAAVDYLVKPYDDERFEQAFARARRLVELEQRNRVLDDLVTVLRGAGPASAPESVTTPDYLDRIAVQSRGRMAVVPVAEIDYIAASGVYAELHVGDSTYIVREAIQELEAQLDPQRWLRIHRSAIVRVELVEMLVRAPSGDYEVQLRNGTRLRVGRSRRKLVQRRLGKL